MPRRNKYNKPQGESSGVYCYEYSIKQNFYKQKKNLSLLKDALPYELGYPDSNQEWQDQNL
mgnify:CR=1 FL=1